jgi:restriction endonuclease S subunit
VSSLVARGVPAGIIASGHWAIITPSAGLLPDYLAWYLAHPATERMLGSRMVGSSLPFVPLSAMRELEIEVPALEVQERIVRVQSLHRRQQELEQQLVQARERFVNAVTRAALERAVSPNH